MGAGRQLAWVFERAIRPSPAVHEPWQRRRARLLSGSLLGIASGVTLTLLLTIAFVDLAPIEKAVAAVAVPVTIGLYAISRRVRYELAALVCVAAMSASSWAAVALGHDRGDRAVALPFLILPVVVAALVTSIRVTIAVAVANLAAAVAIVLAFGDTGRYGTGIESIGFLVVSLGLFGGIAWARQRDHDELAESRHNVRHLISGTRQGVLIHDQGVIVEANDAAAVMHGFESAADLLGHRIEQLPAPGSLEIVRAGMAAGGDQSYELLGRRRDGSRFVAQVDVTDWTREGRPVRIVFLRDVTEERRLAERLELALEVGAMGTWDMDSDRASFRISEELQRLYGLDARGGDVDSGLELIPEEHREHVLGAFRQAIEDSGAIDVEHGIVSRPGARFWSRGRALRGTSGESVSLVGVTIDVTERHELEERLRRSQRLEAIGQLAGGIAHDFNNLLTAVGGYAALLRAELAEDDSRRGRTDEILAAAERAATLTSQLLAFSRRQALEPRRVDLNAVVRGSRSLLEQVIGEGVGLELALADGLPAISADSAQLELALVNLALNGRDAMPDGGTLTVVTRAAGKDAVEIAVVDTGSGMSAEVLEHAFEPFFTTKPVGRGSGLGLASVHGVVSQSGGSVDIESAPGAGTTVRLGFPAAEPAAEPVAAPQDDPVQSSRGNGETVLIVEDDAAIRRLAGVVLRRAGYTVSLAGDAVAAERLARELGHVDVLVTDVLMPGMSGIELADRLTAVQPGLRVVFASGYADGALAAREADLGGALLPKPFQPADLVSAVRVAIDR